MEVGGGHGGEREAEVALPRRPEAEAEFNRARPRRRIGWDELKRSTRSGIYAVPERRERERERGQRGVRGGGQPKPGA